MDILTIEKSLYAVAATYYPVNEGADILLRMYYEDGDILAEYQYGETGDSVPIHEIAEAVVMTLDNQFVIAGADSELGRILLKTDISSFQFPVKAHFACQSVSAEVTFTDSSRFAPTSWYWDLW